MYKTISTCSRANRLRSVCMTTRATRDTLRLRETTPSNLGTSDAYHMQPFAEQRFRSEKAETESTSFFHSLTTLHWRLEPPGDL